MCQLSRGPTRYRRRSERRQLHRQPLARLFGGHLRKETGAADGLGVVGALTRDSRRGDGERGWTRGAPTIRVREPDQRSDPL